MEGRRDGVGLDRRTAMHHRAMRKLAARTSPIFHRIRLSSFSCTIIRRLRGALPGRNNGKAIRLGPVSWVSLRLWRIAAAAADSLQQYSGERAYQHVGKT